MEGRFSKQNRTIILATATSSIIIIIIIIIAIGATLCCRDRRRKARLFRRGITPIDDEEIESWKVGRGAGEKLSEDKAGQESRPNPVGCKVHRPSGSIVSVQKPPAVITYPESSQPSPCSSRNRSMALLASRKDGTDVPSIPIPAVLARAPNSRPGLSDESVQGADAFVAQAKRHPTRLAKNRPLTTRHERSKSTRATTSPRYTWYDDALDHPRSPRRSADAVIPTCYTMGQQDIEGMPLFRSSPPREFVHGHVDQEPFLGGLSPRPRHKGQKLDHPWAPGHKPREGTDLG
ncbi:hypothetical protein UVI_02039370 [Ustilaginoidea virens]|uniref:Uncharacterized protein n=1 Tax=Ustilaginoidea virens TaxID=1159556 RepID=A0A1B5KXX7_USTVR|nr:hypothetical protein UVI_02039370 [Ustilaginoidea virens]